jgi:hypothetical protein
MIDHLLTLLPEEPRASKRLDDIVDPVGRMLAGSQEAPSLPISASAPARPLVMPRRAS